MDKSIEEKLYDSIIIEDLESISNLLSQGNLNFLFVIVIYCHVFFFFLFKDMLIFFRS